MYYTVRRPPIGIFIVQHSGSHDILREYEQAKAYFANRMLFLVGHARGGSTVTARSVNIHPRIMWIPYNNKLFAKAWPKRRSLTDEAWLKRLLSVRFYDPVRVAAARPGADIAALTQAVHADILKRRIHETYAVLPALYYLMEHPDTPLEQFDYWMIKDNSWEGVDLLKKALPSAKIAVVMRDPRSVTVSQAKVFAANDNAKAPGRYKSPCFSHYVQGLFAWLINAIEFKRIIKRYVGDVVVVRYEDIIEHSIPTLNRFYAFLKMDALDESFAEELLSQVRNKKTNRLLDETKQAEFDAIERDIKQVRGLHRRSLTTWKTELSEELLDIMAKICGPLAAYYDYQLESSGTPPRVFRSFFRGLEWPLSISAACRYLFYRATGRSPTLSRL